MQTGWQYQGQGLPAHLEVNQTTQLNDGVKVQLTIRSALLFLPMFLILMTVPSPVSVGQSVGQTLAVVREALPSPSETSSLPAPEGDPVKPPPRGWQSQIWDAIPPETLEDPGRSQILEAYQANDWKPFFIGPRLELNDKAKALLERLQKIQDDGIDPSQYRLDTLYKQLAGLEQMRLSTAPGRNLKPSSGESRGPENSGGATSTVQRSGSVQLASNAPQVAPNGGDVDKTADPAIRDVFKAACDLDVRLADTLVQFASEMHPRSRDWQIKALSGEIPMGDFLVMLDPDSPRYQSLRKAYKIYRDLASQQSHHPVVANSRIQSGETGDHVRTLQMRLQQEGFYGGKISGIYDLATQTAVKEFQKSHRLSGDGVLGQGTKEWLNVSYGEKAKLIAEAMRHFRHSDARLHDRYVRINIPQFTLEYYKDGKVHSLHRVIVGKASGKKVKVQGRMVGENQTPPLSSAIEQIVINPRWYVSDRIRMELNGAAASDPTYFSRQGYVQMSSQHPWGEARLFMPPGPSNPLGRVKFEFPNAYAVYLHDTPKKGLFQRDRRDFSHGCIRVERAKELAEILLADDGNPMSDKLQDYFSSYRQAYIRLAQPVPIIIEYQQVSFNEKDEVVFCSDPYGWFKEAAQIKPAKLPG